MLPLLQRPLAGEADLEPIAALINACDAVDRMDDATTVISLQMELCGPDFDPARDLRLWEEPDGRLVGYGHLWLPPGGERIDGFLRFAVRPDRRGDGLEDEIIAWAAARVRAAARERGGAPQLRARARADQADLIDLLERHGLAVARAFHTLERRFDEPLPAPDLPAGFAVRPMNGASEAAAWAALYNESFVDHDNFHPKTTETVLHYLADPFYRPDLSLVAVAPDGALAGFCWGEIFPDENEVSGRNEGWVGVLGTRRGYRRLGLGRALLLEVLRRLRAAGVDAARLSVDADSPTGATRLYAAVGFRTVYTRLTYAKDLEP
jgi:mycothiol synthase